MDIEAMVTRLEPRLGERTREWCTGVPALADRLAVTWGLRLGPVIDDGASSVAIRATAADGTPVVLKLALDRDFLAEQVAMLRSLAPSGRVPAVLAAEPAGFLMTAVVPGTEPVEHPPAAEWAGLVRDLHAVPVPAGLDRTLRGRAEEFFERIGKRLTGPVTPQRWQRARDSCAELLERCPRPVLLHGDLHLGNVLTGPAGLVAIDPKTCVGDPCFDAVDYVLAAAGREDGVRARSAALAGAAGLDPDRLLGWARAMAPVTALSVLDDEPAVAELLDLG